MKTQYKHLLQRTYLVLVFGFMYLPIAVLIAYSFNENKSRAVFTGFSLKWYASLFHNEMILSALGLSLVLAFVSAIIATVLGTLATIGINSMSRKAQLIINNISYVPVVNPEIITGVSLMLLFVIVQKMGIGGENGVFGWITLLIAHITFNVPYVIFNVGPKLRQLDGSLYNAALDLGCPQTGLLQGHSAGDQPGHPVRFPDLPDLLHRRFYDLLLQLRHHADPAHCHLLHDPQKGQPGDQRAVCHHIPGHSGNHPYLQRYGFPRLQA